MSRGLDRAVDEVAGQINDERWAVVEYAHCGDRVLLLVADERGALELAGAIRHRGTRVGVVDLDE